MNTRGEKAGETCTRLQSAEKMRCERMEDLFAFFVEVQSLWQFNVESNNLFSY